MVNISKLSKVSDAEKFKPYDRAIWVLDHPDRWLNWSSYIEVDFLNFFFNSEEGVNWTNEEISQEDKNNLVEFYEDVYDFMAPLRSNYPKDKYYDFFRRHVMKYADEYLKGMELDVDMKVDYDPLDALYKTDEVAEDIDLDINDVDW